MKICLACGCIFNERKWQCPSCSDLPQRIGEYLAFAPELAEDNSGFNAACFGELAGLEESNFWFRSRNKLIRWALKAYFPKASSFFEIGCGTGFVLSEIEAEFPELSVSGSEIYVSGLSYASERLDRAELFQMDARQIPFKNEFDVIGAFDVLEHITEDELVLQQMYQATCQGGGIILTVPQHKFLWSRFDEYSCHVRRYNAQELKHKVERAGFQVANMTSFVSLLLPLMALSRLMKRQSDKEFDVKSELRVGVRANNLLEKILGFERILISSGLNLPLGGSILLIGRKN